MDDWVFAHEFDQILLHVASYAMHMHETGLEESKMGEDEDLPFMSDLDPESESERLERHVTDVTKKSILVAKLTGKVDAFREVAEVQCERSLIGEPACTPESGDHCWIHERIWDLLEAREGLRERLHCKSCRGAAEVTTLTRVAGTPRRTWTPCPECSITR